MKKILTLLAAMLLLVACEDYHKCKFDSEAERLQCAEYAYRTVSIEGKTWLAENSRFYTDFSYCYDDDFELCNATGRLYTFAAAAKACPIGWHLPSKAEYETLIQNGNFSKLGVENAGFRYYEDNYVDRDKAARLWTSEGSDGVRAYIVRVDSVVSVENFNKSIAASVRCVMD